MVGLREEGDDGDAGVAADDGDVFFRRVGVLDFGDEARRPDDVEGRDAEEASGIVDAFGFEDFGADRDRGVYLVFQLRSAREWTGGV